jgi:hypothetical protein
VKYSKPFYYQYNQAGQYAQYPGYGAGDVYDYPSFNGFELIIMFLSVISLIVAFGFGFVANGPTLRDSQRAFDINQTIKALDSFYTNSSLVPSERYYPISVCDAALNTPDYEWTLREYLTGKKTEKETRVYINPADWRSDPWGKYSKTLGERKIPLKCQDKLQLATNNANQVIYPDDNTSCNYSTQQANEAYYKCYLYSSSVNGDTFSIGYYSESTNQMVIYKRFRQDAIKQVTCVPQKC